MHTILEVLARGRRALPCCAALALALAGTARAYPLVFDGPGGYGVSAGAAEAAYDAGIPRLPVEAIETAAAYGLSIPDPVVLSSNIRSSPSVSNPTTATSRWSVTNGSTALDNAWLVFLTPLSYDADRVGIDLQTGGDWGIVEVNVGYEEEDTYYYPAVHLGAVGASELVQFLMHHIVGEALHREGNDLVLPQYGVGLIAAYPVAEPLALALLALGGALAPALRRRRD